MNESIDMTNFAHARGRLVQIPPSYDQRIAEALESLGEQARIANLIALARIESENSSTPTDALDTLYTREETGVWGETVKLHTRTEIAAALGIEEVQP